MTQGTKPKRGINYTQLAALITAVSTAAGLFWNQTANETKTERVQGTILTLLQYRLQRAEEDLGDQGERLRILELELARRSSSMPPPAPIIGAVDAVSDSDGDGVTTVEVDGEGGDDEPERALEAMVKKVKGGKALGLDDVQEYVNAAQRQLKLEDF